MFHMLSCFDLANEVSIFEFQKSNNIFLEQMRELRLIESSSPIGRRNKHPVMDTDTERDHEYFYTISFKDKNQCDQAVEYIQAQTALSVSIHGGLSSKIQNQVFICWEDICLKRS